MNSKAGNHNSCSDLLDNFSELITSLSTEENKKEFEQFIVIIVAAINEICYYGLDKDSRFELITENLEKLVTELGKK